MLKKKIIIWIIAVVAAMGILLALSAVLPNVSGNDGKPEYLLIRNNASFTDVLDSLHTKKSLRSVLAFEINARLLGYPAKIHGGRYELSPGINNFRLLNRLMKGRQTPVQLSFNNIRTKEQFAKRIAGQLEMEASELLVLLNDNYMLGEYGFDSLTVAAMFIPNTYEFYWTVAPAGFFVKMHSEYEKFWNETRRKKAEEIGLGLIEVSTLASIVEEETNLASEKPIVAGLYLNRLHKGMLLQADPTVKFALGDFGIKRVLFKHIDDSRNSSYNTYTHKGLPPGPIRLPSIESIDAVLNYEANPYFFMCAKGSGGQGHDFAVTFAEHLKNAERYRKEMDRLHY
ncbi:MAG: endolytic transglycosylase MltG [Prevotellaceae bacterium]|jgi:UPF0755 protein|nr:endolytic transglycosylase MltG [Prevotellaceae bacterium]